MNAIPNNQTNSAMVIRNRLFHIDPRFRECTQWLFFHFDHLEKLRIVDNNCNANITGEHLQQKDILTQSKYDNSWIYDDSYLATVPIGIRGSAT